MSPAAAMPACAEDPLFARIDTTVAPRDFTPVVDEAFARRWGDPPPPAIAVVLAPTTDARVDLRAIEREAIALASRARSIEDAIVYLGAARSDASYRIYDVALSDWVRQCAAWGVPAVPVAPDVLVRYLAVRADEGRAHGHARRTIVAINALHAALGIDSHAVTGSWMTRQVVRGIARERGRLPVRQARALVPEYLERALPYYEEMALTEPIRSARNVALLALTIATAARRSSVRGLHTDDVEVHPEGLRVTYRLNKTRQTAGDVHVVDVHAIDSPICPVRAVLKYAEVARLERGPLFRGLWPDGSLRAHPMSPAQINRVVKDCAAAIGLDPAGFSAHSMRVGTVTAGYEAGLSAPQIMQISDHRLEDTMLGYVRPEHPFRINHVAAIFGSVHAEPHDE